MRKRASLANPSLAVNFALSSFAASVVKEEVKKKRRLQKASAANKKGDDQGENWVGDDVGAEESSSRIKNKKRTPSGCDDNSSEMTRSPWVDTDTTRQNCNEILDHDEDETLQDWSIPTDTLVALKMMCQQFPKIGQPAVRPFVLRSQIYSSISDRTIADRELEELKRKFVVRIFKLNSGNDDFGIMLMEDYLKQIEEEKNQMSTKRSKEETRVYDWFTSDVVPAQTGVSIRHQDLIFLLSKVGKVNEEQISLLINSGLLVRQIVDENTYWFGIPNVGSLLKSLSAGRNELKSFLAKRKYKEMLQAALEKKRLRYSQFDIRFHIRDLIGSGHLFSIQTPAGPLIRVARD